MDKGQRDLFDTDLERIRREQLAFLEKAQGVVARITPKEACYVLGVSRPALENALAMRDRKNPPTFAWALHLIKADPEHELLHYLAESVNCEVHEAKDTRTPEQVVAETRAYLQRLGPVGLQIARDLRLLNR